MFIVTFSTSKSPLPIMLVLLLGYYLAQVGHGEAGPILSLEPRDLPSYGDQSINSRTTWSIVWSCLSTIFLCTWVAVHPNVAFRREKPNMGRFEKWLWDPLQEFFRYKLILFLWALLVPEYILAWAARQYIRAGEIQKEVPGWTRGHGFFMIMGGFHLFRPPALAPYVALPLGSKSPSAFVLPGGNYSREDEVPVCPIQIKDISIEILKIVAPTEAELKDKGKSDGLTKLIVLVQTLWFVIQCIARGLRDLPLTELEIVTLAYAMLNLFTFVFWWDKPRNVECPVRLYKPAMRVHANGDKGPRKLGNNWFTATFFRVLTYVVGQQDDSVDIVEVSSIPMFWSGRLEEKSLFGATLGPAILGVVFGIIHCIAWSSEFPSAIQAILWHVSCIAMTLIPLVLVCICAVGRVPVGTLDEYGPWIKLLVIGC